MKEYIVVTEQKRMSPIQMFGVFIVLAGLIYVVIEVLVYAVNILESAESINPPWQIIILAFLGFLILVVALMEVFSSFFRFFKESDNFNLKGIKPKKETRITAEKLLEIKEVKYPEESKLRKIKEKKIWELK